MDILVELKNLRQKISSIDNQKYDWKLRSATIQRLQKLCNHHSVGVFKDGISSKYVCEICGKEVKAQRAKHNLTLAQFINLKNLEGNIVDID